ncbi:glycosyltransferase family 62 protein [Pseudohyphozyma bogoriensis]|nr:glycosyltransferase family 62 protein [Pseudohyphozyma bogoriensis]
MFGLGPTSRKKDRSPLPTRTPYSNRDVRQTPPHRVLARAVLAHPVSFFAGVVGFILLLSWLAGLAKPEERARDSAGRRVVARDWTTRGVGLEHGSLLSHKKDEDTVLILTPMKNSIEHIWHFFHLLDTLTYPRHLIQIGVLVSDTADRTYARALELADERQYTRKKKERYSKFSVFKKDFAEKGEGGSNIGGGRHDFGLQVLRRKLLAKSRTWLLGAAMTPEVDWVLWMDVDVVEYDKDMLQTLLGWSNETRADVVVPNCMWKTYNEMGSYDRNNWAETPESLEMKALLKPDDVLIEGYEADLKTFRKNMADHYPTTEETPATMELDGVGGCTTLLETEGFAQIAKALGAKLIGLPKYYVYHGLYG